MASGMINFENLDKFTFPGVGRYGIPQIAPVCEYPQGEFIPMNYAKTAKDPSSKIVHCFVDDYQFTRYWNTPDKYIPMLSQFYAVCSPDFSTYTDMPLAMQIYNHYRKHWNVSIRSIPVSGKLVIIHKAVYNFA